MRRIIKITFRIGVIKVNGRRNYALIDTQHANNRLYSSGSSQKMPYHRFGRADHKLISVIAEYCFDGTGLQFISMFCGCAVRINIINICRTCPRILQGPYSCILLRPLLQVQVK